MNHVCTLHTCELFFTHELSITHVYKQLTSNIEYLNDYELFPSAKEHSQVN